MANLTPELSKAERALLNWPQMRLGARSGLSKGTIRAFEDGRRIPAQHKLEAIRYAFEAAGVAFVSSRPDKLAVRLKRLRRTNLSDGEAGIIDGSEM
ncbi:helix-turn-helix domain-containing protein [Mesorhizobium sp. ORM8.1]